MGRFVIRDGSAVAVGRGGPQGTAVVAHRLVEHDGEHDGRDDDDDGRNEDGHDVSLI